MFVKIILCKQPFNLCSKWIKGNKLNLKENDNCKEHKIDDGIYYLMKGVPVPK